MRPISWLLAPTWGIAGDPPRARSAASVWFPVAMCAGLGIVYLVLAGLFLRIFERAARARATLSLT